MNMVQNQYGVNIDFDAAFEIMDPVLRVCMEKVYDFESDQEYFDMYCFYHLCYYKEQFEANKENPVM